MNSSDSENKIITRSRSRKRKLIKPHTITYNNESENESENESDKDIIKKQKIEENTISMTDFKDIIEIIFKEFPTLVDKIINHQYTSDNYSSYDSYDSYDSLNEEPNSNYDNY